MGIKDYKDLIIWQKGIEIVSEIYSATSFFPKHELFGMTSQMRRAAVSIPSNIAEGFARHYTKEYIHFLYMSLGSCAELETQVIISNKMNYLDRNISNRSISFINQESKMTSTLITVLRKS